MDIHRPHETGRKRRRRLLIGGGLVILIAAVTMALSQMKPLAPSVERGTVWIDTVRRGPMLRQVRGSGTLVPDRGSMDPSHE